MFPKLTAALRYVDPLAKSPSLNGAESVRAAIREVTDLRETEFRATLGEPEIEKVGGEFASKSVVTVPVRKIPYGTGGSLTFDLPAGLDDEDNAFLELLDHLGVTLDTLEEIEGKTVPLVYDGGNAFVDWRAASYSDEGSDIGTEEVNIGASDDEPSE